MSQTSYSINPAAAFRGLLGDPAANAYIRSFANGAAAAQGFGIMVRADVANPVEQFDIFSATGQTPLGVLVHQQPQQDPALADPLGVALLETVGVLRLGRIWVRVEEAVVANTDPVFFRHTSGGGGTEIGAFRTDADTASADALPQSAWLTTTTAAGVALLDLIIPS